MSPFSRDYGIMLIKCFAIIGQGSCIAAGYYDCCHDFIDASNRTIFLNFTCQDPMGGRCFCDFACHSYLDCCEDIERICPSKYLRTHMQVRVLVHTCMHTFYTWLRTCHHIVMNKQSCKES